MQQSYGCQRKIVSLQFLGFRRNVLRIAGASTGGIQREDLGAGGIDLHPSRWFIGRPDQQSDNRDCCHHSYEKTGGSAPVLSHQGQYSLPFALLVLASVSGKQGMPSHGALTHRRKSGSSTLPLMPVIILGSP